MKRSALILTGQFPPDIGGIGTFAEQIAEALASDGVEVTVLTSTGAVPEADCGRRYRVRRGPGSLNRKFFKLVSMVWLAVVELRRTGRGTTLIAMAWPHEGTVAYLVSRLLRISYAVVVHGSEITWHARGSVTLRLMQTILGGAARVLANSRYTLRLASTYFADRGQAFVLNPCIGPVTLSDDNVRDNALEAKWELGGRRVLFTASRLTRRKGHAEVIRALALLRAEFPTLCYVFTGDGAYAAELQRTARDAGCEDMLRPVGRVNLETLDWLYRRCDLYVSPGSADDYDYEGFGISFLEAAVHGKVAVAGQDGGVADAIVDGETGVLVNPQATEELAGTIRRLLRDDAARAEMGRRARRRALDEFGLPAMTRRLREIDLPASQHLAGADAPSVKITAPQSKHV